MVAGNGNGHWGIAIGKLRLLRLTRQVDNHITGITFLQNNAELAALNLTKFLGHLRRIFGRNRTADGGRHLEVFGDIARTRCPLGLRYKRKQGGQGEKLRAEHANSQLTPKRKAGNGGVAGCNLYIYEITPPGIGADVTTKAILR